MATQELDVLIVGAGFGGCYLLHLLRKQGLKVKVFEAGSTLGGVWCNNRYPGARVDCEFPYYGFSDPAIWKSWVWTERYPNHVELRKYFQHVTDIWKLNEGISFNTQVVEARWENDSWIVKTADNKTCKCTWFLAAVGTSFKSHTPDWKGLDSYKGQKAHSAHWTDNIDLTGKSVAVIGAGASGIQIMQEAGKVASSVVHYVRSPNIAIPMRQRQISKDEIVHHRPEYPHVFKACRTSRTGLPTLSTGRNTFDDTAEEREAVYEEQWQRGGFSWATGCYNDYALSKDANRDMYDFWVRKVRARIKDPKKRDILAPLEPPYWVGTKRPSLEQDYYEQCDKPHVEVTNSPILEITETGIVTKEGSKDFDVIAIATGFDAVTGGLKTMGIKGKDGTDLQDYWKDGVKTNLGMMVHGYPNMYIVYGPQAPTSFTNGPPFIEMQCEWIANVIAKQQEENYSVAEADEKEEAAWAKHVADIANMTLAVHTDSWYMGANVPGKKREMLLYLGGIPLWDKACQEALDNWKGFNMQPMNGSVDA